MSNQYNHQVSLIEEVSIKPALEALKKPYRNQKANEKLLNNVINVRKHKSVSEHIVFKFDINGISRAVLQELVRHRIASYTVESTRFCLKKISNNYRLDFEKHINDGKDNPLDVISMYFNMNLNGKTEEQKNAMISVAINSLNNIAYLVEMGLTNDDIKPFIPEGLRTSLVWTINLRSLNNFLELRLDKNAFIEMRMFAEEIQKLAKSTEAGFLVYSIPQE